MDTCRSAKHFTRTMYCTKLLHHMYTKIWTLSCRGISEHHGIFSERKKKTPCIKVGCLRPAVTFCLRSISPHKNRPVFDLTVLLGVQFIRDEEMEWWGEDPLTSVLLRLPQQWTLCQTEGWAELQPGATTAAPGSFGFDDTETTTKMKRTLVSNSSKTHSQSAVLEIVIRLGFSVMFSLCWLWCMLTDSEHSKKRVREPDTVTVLIFSQQSSSVPNTY